MERVVNHRREKINGLHERNVIGQTIHTGIVMRLRSDQYIRIDNLRQAAQNLSNTLRREFACSACTAGVVDQSFFPAEKQHAFLNEILAATFPLGVS